MQHYSGRSWQKRAVNAKESADYLFELGKQRLKNKGNKLNRAFFLFQVDEILLDAAIVSENMSYSWAVRSRCENSFPYLSWCRELDDAVDEYQRCARKWIWHIKSKKYRLLNRTDALESLLTLHERIKKGEITRELLKDNGQNALFGEELDLLLGDDTAFDEKFVLYLKKSCFDATVNGFISRRNADVHSSGAGDNGSSKAVQGLKKAQYLLMWMGIFSTQHQGINGCNDELCSIIKQLWQYVLGGMEDMKGLTQEQWAQGFYNEYIKDNSTAKALIVYSYESLRNPEVKAYVKMQFVCAYTIALSGGNCQDIRTLSNNAVELLENSFGAEGQLFSPMYPIRRILRTFQSKDKRDQVDLEIASYLYEHFDFVEACFQKLLELDLDEKSRLKSELDDLQKHVEENLVLSKSLIQREAVGNLLASLSDPIYGNLLGQLYRISQGRQEPESMDEMRRILENYFRLLGQNQIHPVEEENCQFPGWKIDNQWFVKPTF